MAGVIGQLPLFIILICTIIIPSIQYFSYSDCNRQCREEGLPCIMIKTIGGIFSTMCVDEEGACEMQSSSECPCISDDKPTIGGEKLWMSYKNKPTPPITTPRPLTTPKPNPKKDMCRGWKITSAMQGLMSLTLIGSMLSRRVLKWYRDHRAYQRLQTLLSDDGPYRSTVEDIDSVPQVTDADVEQAQELPNN